MKTNHQINLDCAALMGFKYGPYLDDGVWRVWIEVEGDYANDFDPCEDLHDLRWLSMQTGIGVDFLCPRELSELTLSAEKVKASYNRVDICTIEVDERGILVASCLAIIESDNKINTEK